MSANTQIIEDIKTFLDDNEKCTKKEFVAACGTAFDEHKKSKGKKAGAKDKDVEKSKAAKEDDAEEKPKKELTEYQKFMKEQMPILKAREDEKDDGEEKKKAKDLLKEIGVMWQAQKST